MRSSGDHCMQLWNTLRNIALSTAIILSSGCTIAFYKQPTIQKNNAGYYDPEKTLEQITTEERHQEYYDKIKGTYVPKQYPTDAPPPVGYPLNWDTFVHRWEKNADQRAHEMMYEDLTSYTLQYFCPIQTPQDWNWIVRAGNHSKFGDDLQADFLKRVQDDVKTPFTRGFTDALKEFELYKDITQTLGDWTFGIVEARYTGSSKLIPQIPIIDEFQDRVQNPQKYEPEKPEDKNWWIEKLQDVKLGVDFTGDVTKLSSEKISNLFPRVYTRVGNFLRFRWDIEASELQGVIGFNTSNFAIGINSVTNYETLQPKNASIGVGYLFSKKAILRTTFKYDLTEDAPDKPSRDFNDRREIGIELFWRF